MFKEVPVLRNITRLLAARKNWVSRVNLSLTLLTGLSLYPLVYGPYRKDDDRETVCELAIMQNWQNLPR